MPRIFDNIALSLLPALSDSLKISERADFCVGYFNLRGWRQIDQLVEAWPGGEGSCCRVIVGMQKLPQDELRERLSLTSGPADMDQQAALRLKRAAAQEFRAQLTIGAPTDEDEKGLRRLSAQLKAHKVIVKLFLRHPLHAKLYLVHRTDPNNPSIGFVGSSNLTLAGLSKQGELNVDVLDHDACNKLRNWFENQWSDIWCIDISKELSEIIDNSWAREEPIPPYHIYLKMAYHLSQEALAGLSEFTVPKDFGTQLLAFQAAAVRIAARYVNKRGGVVIGDVVGLGKTIMAAALARIFQDEPYFLETLIICPKNLKPMWNDYVHQYRLAAKVMSISVAMNELPKTPRYRIVLIDESHNLRNREGRRYKAIQEYIEKNGSKCIMLSATPYNKTYLDLSSQLQLFVPADEDLGIRPERLLKELGETEFIRRHQCPVRSLAAFEKSEYPDDWRDLMRLYLVRRTRSFIKEHYAKTDPANGRKYLTFESGERFYFPDRVPKTEKFEFDEHDPNDQYARLYSDPVVNAVNGLTLPRYGLANYIAAKPHEPPTEAESKAIKMLSRAGKRLMGFCRTNLFKRLESGGPAFIQSLERHVLRNFIFLHAIKNDLPLPVGTQGAEYLDAKLGDKDIDDLLIETEDGDDNENRTSDAPASLRDEASFRKRATEVYQRYQTELYRRFKWLRPSLFIKTLETDLKNDAQALIQVLKSCGLWDPDRDAKLDALEVLLRKKYPNQKVLVFTQFADTVGYVTRELKARGLTKLEGVTGDSENPTAFAYRFSPESSKKREEVNPEDELRVLIATDVLSEGQNLQDCAVTVNYDLPWAIIRLIQRAGRVDRIGQQSDKIFCHSFLPAEGVNRIIKLRERVRHRLRENAEVVGSDEAFFEDDMDEKPILDLYNEKSGILEETDTEVDLASYAYQIWKNALDADPKLKKIVEDLPNVVFSTKPHKPTADQPEGVLVYMRTAEGNDSLAWINSEGQSVTESQLAILRAAECTARTPSPPRLPNHHALVEKGVRYMVQEEKSAGGQLGRPSGARFRVYERLKTYLTHVQGMIFATQDLTKAIDQIYRYPLQQAAADALNRQLRIGASDHQLADFVVSLWQQDRLCRVEAEVETQEPTIICSLGLSSL
ncbi:MAG: helicase-related protein [Terriglobia bacterium]|jgi:superfamily II DNA or RNA helicase